VASDAARHRDDYPQGQQVREMEEILGSDTEEVLATSMPKS
jgi:hypothetical protein